MLPTSKLHFSLNFYLLLLHTNKSAERDFRRKIFFSVPFNVFLFFQPSTWVSENRLDSMLFLSIFCLDVVYRIDQLSPLRGKQERPEESLNSRMALPGCGMVVQNCRPDRTMAVVCLMAPVHSFGVWLLSSGPGYAAMALRDKLPELPEAVSHTMSEVSAGPSQHPQYFCCCLVPFLLQPWKLWKSAPTLKYGGWFALESAMRLQNQTHESVLNHIIVLESHYFWLFLHQLFLCGLHGQLLSIHQVAKSQYLYLRKHYFSKMF